jgi:hypothetical protein
MTIREELIAQGLVREEDGELTRIEPTTPVLRLDSIGRAVAAQRIARPGGIERKTKAPKREWR